MNMPSHDAQREMEQRALRNVRGLVDRMEDADRLDARKQRRMLVGLVGGVAIAIAVIVAMLIGRHQAAGDDILLPPPANAPATAPG